jgi:hypothetical protein
LSNATYLLVADISPPEAGYEGKAYGGKEGSVNQMRQLRYASRGDALGFAQRTKKNLAFIEEAARGHKDVHVVTQVVNSLLGLVVFPWERGFADRLERLPVAELTRQDWPKWRVTKGESPQLGDVLCHLRNGIAHGHLAYDSNSLAACRRE